jgi:NADP-dependent 3-hydroxy acid dehydrogenase YdfG
VRGSERFAGRTVAVTGGARGIGRAIAKALADRGMRVAIGDLDLDVAQETAQQLGNGVRAYSLDVTDETTFAVFLEAAEHDVGHLDVLVNNAGIMPTGPFLGERPESTRRQWEINIGGVVNGCRLVLPRFVERGSGHVINVSSVAGRTGYAGIASYSGTKFYVYGFSEGLRTELQGTGVDLTVVMPGFVQTDLTAGIGEARFFKRITPEDVAGGVVRAVERPRFDVFVPKVLGPMGVLTSMLPRRARDAMLRFAKADRLALEADATKRAAYEARAAGRDRPDVDDPSADAQRETATT